MVSQTDKSEDWNKQGNGIDSGNSRFVAASADSGSAISSWDWLNVSKKWLIGDTSME
jgi:hypothetical protein